ncbi:NAD(P)/FAD-dependent oxidoreductase [Profundibacterium mesophilum]|uniref:AgaE n=1 Tax=Profundibacterium mesophilum KAUST100406-0324 TaxID=1037889 RepID=A0A921TCW5_9RHOB|nr:FAD-binding oxidoreductase [Profundibacterium mesophilum]KAF0675631.1 putative AgaE [Profundibacterium mesophilum KAUST100406-0324]
MEAARHSDGPVTAATTRRFRGQVPQEADLVIIGGGIAGVTAALFAARAGLRCVLLEKGRIAGEQSSRNWGWIRQQGRDPAELPIVVEAARHWRRFDTETGGALGLRQTGTLYLVDRERDLERYDAWLPHARANGIESKLLSDVRCYEMMPAAAGGWKGALWTASDMRAEPFVAVPELARHAERAGAVICEEVAVRRLDIVAGKVAGAVSETGRISAPRVVLAGGAWSSLFLRNHGVWLPQLSVRASVAATAPMPEVFAGCAADSRLAFRRRADGGYTLAPSNWHELFIGPDAFRALRAFAPQIRSDLAGTAFRPAAPRGWPDAWSTPRRWSGDEVSPFERMRVLDPRPSPRKLREIAGRFAARFPRIGPVRLAGQWAGMIDTMPDIVPVLDRCAALPGLIVATGLSGHGFGIGPGIGRIAADLAMDRDPGHDLTRFRMGRFSDGSPIAQGPHL